MVQGDAMRYGVTVQADIIISQWKWMAMAVADGDDIPKEDVNSQFMLEKISPSTGLVREHWDNVLNGSLLVMTSSQ